MDPWAWGPVGCCKAGQAQGPGQSPVPFPFYPCAWCDRRLNSLVTQGDVTSLPPKDSHPDTGFSHPRDYEPASHLGSGE